MPSRFECSLSPLGKSTRARHTHTRTQDRPKQHCRAGLSLTFFPSSFRPEEFDIETSGLELVNVTSYTGRYGGGHTYTTSASRVTLSQMLEFVVVVLSILCLFAFTVNLVFIVYRWVLTKRIVQTLEHAKSE